jgi:hypothetical protein
LFLFSILLFSPHLKNQEFKRVYATNWYKGGGGAGTWVAGTVRNAMRGARAAAVHVANTRANSLKEQTQQKEKSAELVKEAISSCYAAANSGQHGQGILLMKLGLLKQKHLAGKNGTTEKQQRFPSSQGNYKISPPIIDSENKPTPFGTTTNAAVPATLAGQRY